MKDKNYLPFDLEAAKAGRPVMTARGEKVEIVRFDLNNEKYPLLGVITLENGKQEAETYTIQGRQTIVSHPDENPMDFDLVMAPLEYKDTMWVNVYFDGGNGRVVKGNYVFSSENEAKVESRSAAPRLTYLDTVAVKVEWHEGEPQPGTAAGD